MLAKKGIRWDGGRGVRTASVVRVSRVRRDVADVVLLFADDMIQAVGEWMNVLYWCWATAGCELNFAQECS
jgi:hypothetical protein